MVATLYLPDIVGVGLQWYLKLYLCNVIILVTSNCVLGQYKFGSKYVSQIKSLALWINIVCIMSVYVLLCICVSQYLFDVIELGNIRFSLGGVPCGAFYTTHIWVYEIQECLFLYSVYWFMAFTIKIPLTVNICLYFYQHWSWSIPLFRGSGSAP